MRRQGAQAEAQVERAARVPAREPEEPAQVERAARVREPEQPAPARRAERPAQPDRGRAALVPGAADPALRAAGMALVTPARAVPRRSVLAGPTIRPDGNKIVAL